MLEDMNAKLLAIHVAKATKLSMDSRQSIEAITDAGLEGDRYEKQGSRGQVTLQSAEQLAEAAEILGSTIEPGATRRNLTLSGVELRPEPGQRLHRLVVADHVIGLCKPGIAKHLYGLVSLPLRLVQKGGENGAG